MNWNTKKISILGKFLRIRKSMISLFSMAENQCWYFGSISNSRIRHFLNRLAIRVIKVLTDLAADLTQNILLGTKSNQRLLKPFFDIPKNRGEATFLSYFIEAVYLLTLRGRLASVFRNIKKWF